MGSQSDDETGKPATACRHGHVTEDDQGHQVWEGTIRTIKLSLLKTGLYRRSDAQKRLQALQESGSEDAQKELEEELEIVEGGGGFDPYDSSGE